MNRSTVINVRESLTRDEVVSVIQGRSIARRVPVQIHVWVHPETFGAEAAIRDILAYPADIRNLLAFPISLRPGRRPAYRWALR
jgi:hypothetical protein